MRRIFFYSSNGIKVFLWKKKKLLSVVDFGNDKQSFAEYLKQSPAIDSQLLVDVIDEDFRRESIPHVNARDRKALIQRLVDRHYRDEEHYQVQLLARSKQGRKDDNILLSSLSNFEKISPWIEILQENAVAIAGIWSVPHLTIDLLKLNKIDADNILLVTRELPWSQRETFFHKGKMLFSRLERLDIDLHQNPAPDLSWQYLRKGAEQIEHFVTNQRIIGFTDKIQVIGIIDSSPPASTPDTEQNNQQIQYRFIEEKEFIQEFCSSQSEPLKCDSIYAWICAQKSFSSSHYKTKDIQKAFIRYYVEKSFKAASYFAAFFLVSAAAFFSLYTVKTNKNIEVNQEKTQTLRQQYVSEFGAIANQLGDAELVKNSVNQANLLNLESKETPQKYFSYLSSIYSKPRFKLLALNELLWKKQPRKNIQEIINQLTAHTPTEADHLQDTSYQQTPTRVATKYQAILQLSGELNREHLDYRNTVTVMLELVNSLQNLPIVSDIYLIKMPVDIRPKSNFSDKRGIDEASLLKNTEADRYEILIVLESLKATNS